LVGAVYNPIWQEEVKQLEDLFGNMLIKNNIFISSPFVYV
jgi:hypothetical protein